VEVPPPVLALAELIQAAGGRLYVVGGAVRDHALGQPAKDLDLEVHGLSEEALGRVLRRHHTARRVGQTFPVFKVPLPGLGELDVALPRSSGPSSDPLAEAARHRDLTLNAMLWDPLTASLLDPWGGAADLAARRLRAVDPDTFAADPLRALRVAVFAARLGATPEPALVALCRGLDLSDAGPERVGIELQKLWLQAPDPAVGLGWIDKLGLGPAVLPGVALTPLRLAACGQAASWRDTLPARGPGPLLALCWSVLLTDHPTPKHVLDRADVHSVQRWPVRDQVLTLLARDPALPTTDTELRTLAEHHPAWLALRRHAAWQPDGPALALLDRAALLGVATAPLPGLLQGRDLLALGVQPGPTVGLLLADLRTAQLAGTVETTDQAQTWVARRIGCEPDALPDGDEPTP
jgi:tRNA nucleotidyltransferase (CCA-adding enzyme)